jgi:CheY-like chemotaxis protein
VPATIHINPEDGRLPRILIIDDNPQIHRDFELVLLEEPANAELDADEQRVYGVAAHRPVPSPTYLLLHAYSGLEGVEKVKSDLAQGHFFQLAFVDIRMPGIDGVETIARLWRVDPKIQMVICTAYADYSQEDLAGKLGQTDKLLVLKKPFDSIEVTQIARTLTEKWYLARQAALKMEQMELLVSQRTQKILELQRQGIKPAIGMPAASVPPPDSTGEDIAGKKLPLVLLVENDADIKRDLQRALDGIYELVEATDDQAGYEQALEMVPDLIIIDISPPQINGLELCRKLKAAQLTSHIPTILFASRGTEDYQLNALEAGADDYVSRPFQPATLKARLDQLLEARRKSRAEVPPEIAAPARDVALNQADAQFLQRATAVIEQRMSDFEFDVDTLAQLVGVSRRQLFRKLKAVIDTTPNALIRSLRLKRASQLLLESEMTVTEITFAVGFQDVKYFRTLFKEQFGVLPSEYLDSRQEGAIPKGLNH